MPEPAVCSLAAAVVAPAKESECSDATILKAIYTSPSNALFTISSQCLPPSSQTVTVKTEYLSQLRKAVATTQEAINKELTMRMQEDKLRQEDEEENSGGGDGVNRRKNKGRKDYDEAKEEENYGEEEQGDDD